MFNRIVRNISRCIGIIISFIFPPFIFYQLRKFFFLVHSGWISTYFKKVGKSIYIEFPFNILGAKNIEIGDNFNSFARLRIEAITEHNGLRFFPLITIGDNVAINYDCHIGCTDRIIIGNNVLIASRVFITDHSHGTSDNISLVIAVNERPLYSKGPVIIQDNTWIGEGVIILPNVTIGKNCIIGANAVVTTSFPDNSIIAGIPAKLIKKIN